MGRNVERDSRAKAEDEKGAEGHGAHPAATSQRASNSRCPSPEGEGAAGGANPWMLGLRVRVDGWTAVRTRVFLASLTQAGCVTDAARVAGVSRKSVNDARRRFAKFDRACAEAVAKAKRGLEAVAHQRAVEGREMIIYRGGKEVERRVMPSDSILALLLKRGELGGPDAPGVAVPGQRRYDPEATITAAEHFEGWRFDPRGVKYFHPTSAIARLGDKLRMMQAAVAREEAETGECRRCHQPMPAEVRARLAERDDWALDGGEDGGANGEAGWTN